MKPAFLYSFLLATLVVICLTVLAWGGKTAPDVISTIGLVSVGVAGGVAIPSAGPSANTVDQRDDAIS